jgi:hypothetical protein
MWPSAQSVTAATGQILLAAHNQLSDAAARQGEHPGSEVRSCHPSSWLAGLTDAGTAHPIPKWGGLDAWLA